MFIESNFMQDLEQYIKINCRQDSYSLQKNSIEIKEKVRYTDIPKGKELTENQTIDLQHLLDQVGDSFCERLFELIERNKMEDVEVYKKAGIDRRLFSKIRSNPAYHPGKDTVLALAIALKLNMEETKDLLARAEYALSPSNKGDLIVQFFIEHQVYDLVAINFALEEHGLPLLGNMHEYMADESKE